LQKESVQGVYRLFKPAHPLPLVFDSPHSGTVYPDDFGYVCAFNALEKAEDKYVDDLFITAPDHGATLLLAEFPRSYIDVNRCARDIDPILVDNPDGLEIEPSARSHAGMGLIRRLIRPGVPIYDKPLSAAAIRRRIDTYYKPYHDTLRRIIEDAHYRHGAVWHINCHSMPSQNMGARPSPARAPDFVLGDRDGTTCDLDFTHTLRDFLKGLGYRVAINDPYKGVELVQRYSAPSTGRHSLQIEIAKALYLNEQTYQKSNNYNIRKNDIQKLIEYCATYVQNRRIPLAAD
jgi:N-formylglutamate deformylase